MRISGGAKRAGAVAFVLFEGLLVYAIYLLSRLRCCGAEATVGPRDAGEWVALGISVIAMLLLGAVVGFAVAMLVEGGCRLMARACRSGDAGNDLGTSP